MSCPNKVAKIFIKYDLPERVSPWIIGFVFPIIQQTKKIK